MEQWYTVRKNTSHGQIIYAVMHFNIFTTDTSQYQICFPNELTSQMMT